MKAAAYDYARPLACDEAIALVAPTGGMGKFVSGSQSLGPMMNLRLAQPEMLVDLRGIAALRACRTEGEAVELGACITHAEIEDGKLETGTRGLMEYVAQGIAYRAVRNRGTLGGSLAHADPAADWINTMCALNAQYLVRGPTGARVIESGEWMAGAFTTALEPDEILTGVRFTRLVTDSPLELLQVQPQAGRVRGSHRRFYRRRGSRRVPCSHRRDRRAALRNRRCPRLAARRRSADFVLRCSSRSGGHRGGKL